ncbi:MAG: DUF2834 domain-containing protein [Bermanella sp.]
MNMKVVSVVLLVVFSGFTAFTMSIAEQSLLSFGYELVSSPDTAQVVMDLYIMVILALVWMHQDMKAQGKTIKHWLPYAALTLVFVSVGPLLYLALKPSSNSHKSKQVD